MPDPSDAIARSVSRMIHGTAFALTPTTAKTALTPKDEIDALGNFRLWRYRGESRTHETPVLLVHSLISRATIYDVAPGVSLVEFLLGRGYDVFLVDWGAPRPTDSALGLEDYAGRLMRRALDGVERASGRPDVSLVAYCLGGTLSVIYLGSRPDPRVKNLVLLATPFVFGELGLFASWSDDRMFDVDAVTGAYGNLPPAYLVAIFKSLKPASDLGKLYGLAARIDDPAYVEIYRALDQWTNDHIPVAGRVTRELVKDLLRADRLSRGDLCLNGRRVDLGTVTCSVLNCIGARDMIVPPAANRPLIDQLGSEDKREVELQAGHMALLAGRDAAHKLWPELDAWLGPRSS